MGANSDSVSIYPSVYVQAGVSTSVQDDLRRNPRQTPSRPVLAWLGATSDHCAVQPRHPKRFESVLVRRPFERGPIKLGMTHEHSAAQPATKLVVDPGEGRPVFDGLLVDAVQPNVARIEPLFGIDEDGQPYLNPAISYVNDADLTDARGARVCRLHVDGVECQVAHGYPQGCRGTLLI